MSGNCIKISIGTVVDVRGGDRRPVTGDVVRGCTSVDVGNGDLGLNSAAG